MDKITTGNTGYFVRCLFEKPIFECLAHKAYFGHFLFQMMMVMMMMVMLMLMVMMMMMMRMMVMMMMMMMR